MQTYNGCLSRAPVAKVFWTWTWRINNDFRQNLIQMRKSSVVNTQQGACCFGSNGIRTTTENTSRFASLIAGIFIPGSMADTGDKVNRLSKCPYPKKTNGPFEWTEVTQYRSSSSSGFFVSSYQFSSNRSNSVSIFLVYRSNSVSIFLVFGVRNMQWQKRF